MKKKYKLGIIGCGTLGDAILRGAILSDFIRPRKIAVSDADKNSLEKAEDLGVDTFMDNRYVADNCEFLVLAVRAQDFTTLSKELFGIRPEKVISLIGGMNKNTVKNALGIGVKVARCVANLPSVIGSGALAVDMYDFKNVNDCEFIGKLLDCLGMVCSVKEEKLNAISALSGCGSAFVFMFIDAFVEVGVKGGLTKDEAKLLAVQTFFGAAEMVGREEQSLSQLVKDVCDKNFATLEGVKIFESANLRSLIGEGITACVKRLDGLSE